MNNSGEACVKFEQHGFRVGEVGYSNVDKIEWNDTGRIRVKESEVEWIIEW